MLLNRKYYEDVSDKYKSEKIVASAPIEPSSLLTLKIILDQIQKKQAIHFNFQNRREMLYSIGYSLFVELANRIFCNTVDYPNYKINDTVRSKEKISKTNLLFIIEKIENGRYTLKCISRNREEMRMPARTYEKLIEKFTPVIQNVRDNTLKRFYGYFKELNSKDVYDFEPTDFTKKCVFVTPKTFWDELKVKNKIPCIYLPTHRDENNEAEIKSIPALSDCMMFITPKYDACYQNVLLRGTKVDTIVVLDCEEDKLEQIVSDKSRFNFNLVILTDLLKPTNNSQVRMWNWFKEEIEIVNSL